jgi:hypothetical protein
MYSFDIVFDLTGTPTISVTDITTYVDPTLAVGLMTITDPDGVEILQGDINTISNDDTFVADLRLTDDGDPIPGCYVIEYRVDINGARGADQTTTIDYDYVSPEVCLEYDVNCFTSTITVTDGTEYPAAVDVARALELIPPASSNLTAAAPVDQISTLVSPMATKTWTGKLTSTFTAVESGYSVLDSITGATEKLVNCDVDVCKVLNCLEKLNSEYERLLDKNPTKACEVEKELLLAIGFFNVTQSAVRCGDYDLAQKNYDKLQDLIDCDCGCGDSVLSTVVTPLTTVAGPAGPIGPQGPTGPAGDSGIATFTEVNATETGLDITQDGSDFEYAFGIFKEKTIFVDFTYGDNSTGAKYRLDLPFKTIEAAEAVASDGDTIRMAAGNYSSAGLCSALAPEVDTISYLFDTGSVVTYTGANGLFSLSNLNRLNVFGNAEFQGSTGYICLISGNREVHFSCRSIKGFEAGITSASGSSGKVFLQVAEVDTEESVAMNGGVDYYVRISRYNGGTSSQGVTAGSSWSGFADIEISRAICGTSVSSKLMDIGTGGSIAGFMKYKGSLIDTRDDGTEALIQLSSGRVKLWVDAETDSARTFLFGGSGALNCEIVGEFKSAGPETFAFTGTNKNVTISGKATSSRRTVLASYTTTNTIKIKNADLICTDPAGTVVLLDQIPRILFQGAKLICEGSFSVTTLQTSASILVPGVLASNKLLANNIVSIPADAPVLIDSNIID